MGPVRGRRSEYLLIEAGHPDGIDARSGEDEVAPRSVRIHTQATKDVSTTWGHARWAGASARDWSGNPVTYVQVGKGNVDCGRCLRRGA